MIRSPICCWVYPVSAARAIHGSNMYDGGGPRTDPDDVAGQIRGRSETVAALHGDEFGRVARGLHVSTALIALT